jgi:hypothetical protein
MRNAYRLLVVKPERKRLLRGPKLRWNDNIEIDIEESVCEGVDWTHLAQDRMKLRAVVITAMNLPVP